MNPGPHLPPWDSASSRCPGPPCSRLMLPASSPRPGLRLVSSGATPWCLTLAEWGHVPLLSGFPPPSNGLAGGSCLRVRPEGDLEGEVTQPSAWLLSDLKCLSLPPAVPFPELHPVISLFTHLPLYTSGPLEHRTFPCTPRVHTRSGIQKSLSKCSLHGGTDVPPSHLRHLRISPGSCPRVR